MWCGCELGGGIMGVSWGGLEYGDGGVWCGYELGWSEMWYCDLYLMVAEFWY